LTEDLGAPPAEVFAAFDQEPLAAASIAQVYRARLDDGSEVVVKVRRPDIRPIIEADLRWLHRLADIAEVEYPELRLFRPSEVVGQFTRSLRRELDFSAECRSAERIAANFCRLHRPRSGNAVGQRTAGSDRSTPDHRHSQSLLAMDGERVCVQEFIDGISGRQLAAIEQAGLNRQILARRGAHAVLKMIVEDGLFHADPHPGNVFYLPGNRIGFIDFGMIGRLSDARQAQLVQLLLGLVKHEPRRVADVLFEWMDDTPVNEDELLLEIEAFVDQYHGVPLKQLSLGAMLSDLIAILRQHQISLPADLTLLVKAFISLEGMGRELDPDFDMAGQAMPLLEAAMRARYRPRALARRSWQTATEILGLLTGLPQDISRMLRAARRGQLDIRIDVTHLKRVGNQIDSAANRMTIGIVVAALIVGSSIVMTVPGGPTLLGLPLFGLLGYLGAGLGSIWLLRSISKSARVDPD
jgi:ubiquinone biosynthesis protein